MKKAHLEKEKLRLLFFDFLVIKKFTHLLHPPTNSSFLYSLKQTVIKFNITINIVVKSISVLCSLFPIFDITNQS
ncbi:hypothetical protein B6A42_15795 [Vibrio coralliilyticus]|nr:hypothetical protein B6A42_15795 [Vibrio coralliilyticus]